MLKIIHAVSVMNRAGQETFLMNVYRKLDRNQIQFDFQCSRKMKGDYDEEIIEMGGKILYLDENEFRLPVLKYLGQILQQYKFFKKNRGYDIYHIHTYHAFDAWLCIVGAKLGGVKHIVLHSHNTNGMHKTLHKVFRILLRYMKIERFCCSQMAGEWMYGKKEMSRGRVSIIKNGVDTDKFKYDIQVRDKERRELELEDQFVVGHIGRFNIQKNHKFLIRVFKEIKEKENHAILLLIGTGELQQEIKDMVIEYQLQDSVQFLGTRKDVAELLNAMDLLVFPSLHEGLSVVAIEAQAAGVPILAADTLTPETKVTECIEFFSLAKTEKEWAEKALSYKGKGHKYTRSDIQKAGYDICATAEEIVKRYSSMVKKRG